MTPISVCIIGRDEEKYLERLFTSIEKSMGDYPHELVFVDTGSGDNTKAEAAKYTDLVFSFQWEDDYSKARNFAMGKASNDWILFVDCDEEMTEFDALKLTEIIESGINCFGVVKVDNLYTWLTKDDIFHETRTRFCNRLLHEYSGKICERLIRKNPSEPNAYFITGITLVHYGYYSPEEGNLERVNRNLNNLFKEVEEVSVIQNPELYIHVGQYYYIVGNHKEALKYFRRGMEYLDVLDDKSALVMTMNMGYTLLRLDMNSEALQLAMLKDKFGYSADYMCMIGNIYVRSGMLEQAMDSFESAISLDNLILGGSASNIPMYNMAGIYELLGENDKALEMYRKCGDYAPAVERLKELQ